MSDTSFRDDIIKLLTDLTETVHADVCDHEASVRHLGVAGLNLATEADPQALLAAGETLPWVAIYLMWQRQELSPEQLTEQIQEHRLLRQLNSATIRRRLRRAQCTEVSEIRRNPGGADHLSDGANPRAEILEQLVGDDRRLDELAGEDDSTRRDALMDDSGLLATAVAMGEGHPAKTDVALPDWPVETPAGALDVLARFERTEFDEVPIEWTLLSDRARNFEKSLATHLNRHGVLNAVRAALAFAPAANHPTPSSSKIRRFLTGFSVFAADPTLLELTMALIRTRHRTIDHLQGTAPLGALEVWADYLRGECAGFGEARGFTLREATNFAHYALHLIDICDLGADSTVTVDDAVRRAIMDIEDELKEFVLVGQRKGYTDGRADLHRYEQARWNTDEPRALLADRLARICGAWRSGHRSGPPGSAHRPDDELFDNCMTLVAAEDDPRLDAATNLIHRARLRGLQPPESWSPRQVLSLLCQSLFAARHSQDFDTGRPFTIDFGPLTRWLDADAQRPALVEPLLKSDKPISSEAQTGLTARAEDQTMVVGFSASDELEALLTLLSSSEDESFAAELRRRLEALVDSEPIDSPGEQRRPEPSVYRSTDPKGLI